MSKTITIDELIPLLKKGWVACGKSGIWKYFEKKPHIDDIGICYISEVGSMCFLDCFNIAPFDGDWKKLLRRIK